VTETLTAPFLLDCADLAVKFGWYDVTDIATADEMAAANHCCVECGNEMRAKVGGGFVAGKMLGHREVLGQAWTWVGPLCSKCDFAHGTIL